MLANGIAAGLFHPHIDLYKLAKQAHHTHTAIPMRNPNLQECCFAVGPASQNEIEYSTKHLGLTIPVPDNLFTSRANGTLTTLAGPNFRWQIAALEKDPENLAACPLRPARLPRTQFCVQDLPLNCLTDHVALQKNLLLLEVKNNFH